jgi:hypothetical protein
MRKRTITVYLAILLVLVMVSVGGFFGVLRYIEWQRVRDADPTFRPLEPLGVNVLCNPIAGHRYCTYIAEFTPESKLCDQNVSELASLNTLPRKNWLVLVVSTPRVTDSSLSRLREIRTIDVLDVRKSSISDDGVAELRAAFPKAKILERMPKLREHAERDTK